MRARGPGLGTRVLSALLSCSPAGTHKFPANSFPRFFNPILDDGLVRARAADVQICRPRSPRARACSRRSAARRSARPSTRRSRARATARARSSSPWPTMPQARVRGSIAAASAAALRPQTSSAAAARPGIEPGRGPQPGPPVARTLFASRARGSRQNTQTTRWADTGSTSRPSARCMRRARRARRARGAAAPSGREVGALRARGEWAKHANVMDALSSAPTAAQSGAFAT